jgi:hypothetical protein
MTMTQGATLQYWSSSTEPRYRAAELLLAVSDRSDLVESLAACANLLDGAGFLIVSIDHLPRIDGDVIGQAIEAWRNTGSRARLCLAGGHDRLRRIECTRSAYSDVGLLLDGVDAETPPAHLIWDRIEAARFQLDFIAAATRGFRLGCALEAMLGMAKSLGLCTLGEHSVPGGRIMQRSGGFDYVLSPTVDAVAIGRVTATLGARLSATIPS